MHLDPECLAGAFRKVEEPDDTVIPDVTVVERSLRALASVESVVHYLPTGRNHLGKGEIVTVPDTARVADSDGYNEVGSLSYAVRVQALAGQRAVADIQA